MPVRVTQNPKAQASSTPSGRSGPVRVSPKPGGRKPRDKGDDGGILGTISRIPGDVGRDFYQAAVGLPAGLYYMGEAGAKDVTRAVEETVRAVTGKDPERRLTKKAPPGSETKKLGGAIVRSTIEDFKHPLRHPGNTILNVAGIASMGAGTASRVSAAAKAARGAKVGKAAAATEALLTKPKPGVRKFRVGDLEVEAPKSRSALTRGTQRALDKRRQAKALKDPTGRAAKREAKKASGALMETLRAEEALGKADAAALQALGRKLKPGEQYALRVVAEEAPLNKRIAATRESIANSRGAERRRHAKRLTLLEDARKHLADPDGKPEFTPGNTKLRVVFDRMSKVAGSREQLAKELGLLTDEAIAARKTAAGRAAMGAQWTTPAHEAIRRLDKIEQRRVELRPQPVVVPGKQTVKERPRTRKEWEDAQRRQGRPVPEPEPQPQPGRAGVLDEPSQKRLDQLNAALDPLVASWAKELRGEIKEAAKGKGKVIESKEEFWENRVGRRKSEAALPAEDRALEELLTFGYTQGEKGRYRKSHGPDPNVVAEEMLSQVSGREPRMELDLNTLMAVHAELKAQGVDMTKLRKALDERDALIQRMIDEAPTPDEVFDRGKQAAAAAAPGPPKWGKPKREDGLIVHESADGVYRLEKIDKKGAQYADVSLLKNGKVVSVYPTLRDAMEGARRNAEHYGARERAATPPPEDFGTVRTVQKEPDKVMPGVVTPEARAELDELAHQERVAAAEVKPDTGRRQPPNVPGQMPVETLDQPARPSRMNKPRLVGQDDFVAGPDAVYIPDVEQRVGRSGRIPSVGASGTIGHLRSPIREGYTGAMKRAGREPLKTTRAVAEAKLAVSRFARLAALRGKLLRASSTEPRFADDIAIRLDKLGQHESLPKDVRQFLDEPEELARLAPDEQLGKFEALRKQLIVGGDKEISQLAPEQLAEFRSLQEQGKIGWVPKRLLGELARPHAPLSASLGKVPTGVIDSINNAQRLAVLYLKPAYAVPNLLGNLALNIVQQGFAAPKNLAYASMMHWKLGPELTARVDTLMHEGFAAALRGEQGALAGATQAAANVWGKGVDRPFRRASFLHEARRNGYRTPEQLADLLTDAAKHDELIDVTKRANRQIIDYGRLSHREREIVRRLIFFYPWVKGSSVYAGNFVMEYPVKAAVSGQIGRAGVEESDRRLGPRPSYLAGAIGTPGGRLANPASAAILQTPAQAGAAIAGLLTGRVPEVAELTEFPTPALQFGTALYTGENARTGRQYPRNKRGIARIGYDTLVTQTPQYRLGEQVRGTSKARLFDPSPRAGLMQFLLGGIYPRDYDPSRLRALARRERKELGGVERSGGY